MPSVYIETTIPSYYYTARTSAQAVAWHRQTRLWWDHVRSGYSLVTSEAVLAELANAPSDRAVVRRSLLEGVSLLELGAAVDRIAAEYIAQRLMPNDGGLDAVHVAAASLHGIDYLLTWNCKHLANANKAKHLAAINSKLGLHVPGLFTPYTLV